MRRIEELLEHLNALAGGYEVTQWGRGDWSLYRDGVFVVNTLSAAEMQRYIRAIIREEEEAARSALGRDTNAAGSAQGREDRGKTHTEGPHHV